MPESLLLASGSVDQTNSYVFEVTPRGVGESGAKSLQYWSLGNGDDTMVTVWNPADEAQDFLFTLYFVSGHYTLPIHLEPRSSHNFNVSEIVHNQIPDSEGNILPAGIHEGSAKLSGVHAENETVLVSVDAGTYNVRKATCTPTCIQCTGYVSAAVLANPFAVPVDGTTQLNLIGTLGSGGQSNLTSGATWSSSATSVATVATGLVHGVSAGTATVSAFSASVPINVYICSMTGPVCPFGNEVLRIETFRDDTRHNRSVGVHDPDAAQHRLG